MTVSVFLDMPADQLATRLSQYVTSQWLNNVSATTEYSLLRRIVNGGSGGAGEDVEWSLITHMHCPAESFVAVNPLVALIHQHVFTGAKSAARRAMVL